MSDPMPTPLTGAQYSIRAGDYEAKVTELGAGLRSLVYRDRPVITGYQPDELPPGGAGQLLSPWPNRIDRGRFDFGGTTFQLELSEPTRGNAIHGLTRWTGWTPIAQASDEISLTHTLLGRPGYPFCLELSISYRLDFSNGLEVAVAARNIGSRVAPYGTGAHPYLTADEQLIDTCELELPASSWLPTDDRGIPSGPPQDVTSTRFDFRIPTRIGDTRIDHAFTGLAKDSSGHVLVQLTNDGRRVGLWAGPGYDWLQIYTGDNLTGNLRRRALAIEPMTCPPNAFVTGEGMLTLAPGESVTHNWGIQVLQS